MYDCRPDADIPGFIGCEGWENRRSVSRFTFTAEIRGNEILVWFKDGPAYFMQHDHFRHKPPGWEFFTHIDEVGYLDNLQVWTLKPQTHKDWESTRSQIPIANQFLSSKHPTFSIEKLMNP